MPTKMTRGSGNVFIDLGFPPAEAENLRMRATLMLEIRRIIEARKLTQAKSAILFGVSQPRISDLKRGRIELFSIDGLVKMLAHAGMQVTLRVSKAARGA